MPLSVAEVEVNDLPGIANLWLAAHSTINPVERLIYPLGPTPSITTSCLAQEKREFLQPSTRYLKIVDSDRLADQEGAQPETSPGDDGRSEGLEDGTGTGKAAVVPEDRGSISSMIVAFVRFKLWSSDQDASDWDQPYSVSEGELGAIGDINVDIARSFRGQQKRMSRTYIKGRKCICKSFSPKPSFLPFFLPFHSPPHLSPNPPFPFLFPFSSTPPAKTNRHTAPRDPSFLPTSRRRHHAPLTRQRRSSSLGPRYPPPSNTIGLSALSQARL